MQKIKTTIIDQSCETESVFKPEKCEKHEKTQKREIGDIDELIFPDIDQYYISQR